MRCTEKIYSSVEVRTLQKIKEILIFLFSTL